MPNLYSGTAGTLAVPLTRGRIAWIDESDASVVEGRRWHAVRRPHSFYAETSWWDRNTKRRHSIFMHRLLLDAPANRLVDHINGDGLDNRRANIRLTDRFGNARNHRARGVSGIVGVRQLPTGRWSAQIAPDYNEIWLGIYDTAEEASAVYNAAAELLYGEFAHFNGIAARHDLLAAVINGRDKAILRLQRAIEKNQEKLRRLQREISILRREN